MGRTKRQLRSFRNQNVFSVFVFDYFILFYLESQGLLQRGFEKLQQNLNANP